MSYQEIFLCTPLQVEGDFVLRHANYQEQSNVYSMVVIFVIIYSYFCWGIHFLLPKMFFCSHNGNFYYKILKLKQFCRKFAIMVSNFLTG